MSPSRHALLGVLVLACCLPGGACAPAPTSSGDPSSAAVVIASVPEAAAMVREARPLPPGSRGARLETGAGEASWTSDRLALDLPITAKEPMLLTVPGHPQPIAIHRLEAGEGTREQDGNVVRYRHAARASDAVVFARGHEIEELLVLREPVTTGYRLAVPERWSTRRGPGAGSVEIADATGRARVVMRAARAWDANGAPLPVEVGLEHDVVTLSVPGAHAYPLVVDPSWGAAFAPIRIRIDNTSTLLGNGQVLVAGGGASPRSTELLDPYAGTVVLGPEMKAGRSRHTATMLATGQVLLAGGGTAEAELYDPVTRTLAPTGSMSRPRTGHAAVRLRNGKVLVVGSEGNDGTAELYDAAKGTFTLTSARLTTGNGSLALLANGTAIFANGATSERFDPAAAGGAGAWSIAPPNVPLSSSLPVLTRLRDGRMLAATGNGCGFTGVESCSGTVWNMRFNGPTTPVGDVDRVEPTAALLPDGEVVYAGGRPGVSTDDALRVTSVDPPTLSGDGRTTLGHADATSVVLPGGDVLVIGGTQAAVDRRAYLGSFHVSTGSMITPRVAHSVSRLHDGRLLVAGGGSDQSILPAIASAEIFDPATETFIAAGALTVARYGHTSTTLASGKLLLTGGARGPSPLTVHASAELYDPAAPVAARSRLVGAMAGPRMDHAATLLPSGHVLVTGGCKARVNTYDACSAANTLSTAELFDPATDTFVALPPMTVARRAHGAVVMPDGKVLVVGGGDASAEIFDPLTRTFAAITPSGSARDGRTAHLLPDGRVFVAGGATLAPDLFDPTTRTWSFAAALPVQFAETLWGTRADGRLVATSGLFPLDGINQTQVMFDPLATQVGSAHAIGVDVRGARKDATMTLAGSGDLVLVGGTSCHGACIAPPIPEAFVHGDGAPASARPKLTTVPARVTAGTKVAITGSGFVTGPEGSSGTHGSSATNHPLALWVSDVGDAVVPGTILDFTDTTATWLVPATALHGHGMLFVSSGGVLSRGASVTIAPAGTAVRCAYDAECGTGSCVDGVCCDRRCDGKCEGCSAARKTTGEDGVCGPVPPGRDIAGRCFSLPGTACKDGIECATGFCAQGVCCDSTCTGECQACNQPSRAGICSPIKEGACGAACDGDHTLQQVGSPDVDCTPFKCEGQRCKSTCASVKDCAAPFVCSLDGQCTAPFEPTPGTGGVCGCHVVGGADRSFGVLGLGGAAGLALLGFARRRRGRR